MNDQLQKLVADLPPATRARLAKLLAQTREPIAVVGMGFRFPGGGVDGESLWNLLCEGTDAVTEVPRDRWDVDAYYHPDPLSPGKVNTRFGGFLQGGMDRFDADFFGISPREASGMDPQQRLLLEVGWEALEDAGQPPDLLAGSSTGVFIGIYYQDYASLQFADEAGIDAYSATGLSHGIAANRLSYLLDLQGPSLAVDTACSSSLVAVHLACQSLRNEECRVALAGGVSIMLEPAVGIALTKWGVLAPDGRCKAFDAQADGFIRGEGCGVVVLKRLSDALADGDRVRAVIRGSAVNQDGRSNGLTAPSGPAQQRVVGQALAQAGISPGRVEYIEAHGTGTALGDPIEIEALDEVLGPATATTRPCAVGSIKANIGHLEAAAGIAGLIKTVLVLEHGEIPPQAHFHHLNPHIRLENSRIRIPTRQQVWPGGELPRIAGVSAFGFGGTNAHVVLEEAPPVPRASGQGRAGESLILPLSTRSPEALRELGRRYADRLRSLDEGELEGFCATAALRRSHHLEHRLAVTGETAMELAAQLELAAEQRSAAGLGSVSAAAVVFVFSGQGSQYAGMCGQLLDQEPVFRAAIEACEAALGPHAGELFARYGGLLDQLRSGEAESLERTELAQPLLFAVQFGLTALWRSWGIEPAAVLGHSLGEVAAACAAGALELDDAARIVALRGSLMQPLHGRGTMVALPLDHAEALAAIESCAGEVAIAALNGPRSTVLSGTVRALEALVARLPAGGPGARWLPVAYAFHGPEMAPIAQALEAGLAGLRPRTPTLPLISTVTAARVTGQEQLLGAHWAQGAAAPVRFAAGLASLAAQMPEETIYLEIGPRPVLRGALAACLSQGTAVLSSLDQGRNDRSALLHTAATLYQHRVPIRWNQILPHPLTPAPLPLYPWQQKSFWLKNHILPSDKPSPATLNPAARASGFNLDDQLYEITWHPKAHSSDSGSCETDLAGQWLILGDQPAFVEDLAKKLAEKNGNALIATLEEGIAYHSQGGRPVRERLDPGDRNHWKRLLHEGFPATADRRPRGIIYMGPPFGKDESADSMFAAQQASCGVLLHLLQALSSEFADPVQEAPRVWVITQGVQPVEGPATLHGSSQSTLWGLGRTAALELPQFWGGLLDLNSDDSEDSASTLIAALSSRDGEDQIALRGTRRYVARLTRTGLQGDGNAQRTIRADGSYLVTGGLGGLGLIVAEWLVDRGARHIVLMGRNQPSDRAAQCIEGLRERGATIIVALADVAHPSAMRSVLLEAAERGPLRGIVHAAGVLLNRTILDEEMDHFASALHSKAAGAWNLHQLTKILDLDFVFFFSSGASVWGSQELSAYAAANYFLDWLARYRRGIGLAATSINWGILRDGGMSTSAFQGRLAQMGLNALDSLAVVDALDRVLAANPEQITVAAIDWTVFQPVYEMKRRRPLIELIAAPSGALPDQETEAEFVAFLRNLVPAMRRDALSDHLRGEASKILGFPSESILPAKGFFALGMDSVMAVQLRTAIERSLGCSLPATIVFDYPTVEALADYLLAHALKARLRQPEPIPSNGSRHRKARFAEANAALSKEAVIELLDLELDAAERQGLHD